MAIRDKLKASATPYLQPGEQIQAVFNAQTTSQWFALISFWIIIFSNAYRVVVVTDRRILVCQAGRLRTTVIKSVLRELPRATQIGPAHGLWYRTDVLGEKVYIHKRFAKDVALADSAPAA
jgi:Bacterial PH domain